MNDHDTPLRRFYHLAVADPLFAAEGLDLESMERVIDVLEGLGKKYDAIWRNDNNLRLKLFSWRHPFAEVLFPIAFLRAFVACERYRRQFLLYPDVALAETLIRHHKKAHRELMRSLQRFRAAYRASQSLLHGTSYDNLVWYFHANGVSRDDVEHAVDVMEKNASVLEQEITVREEVLSGAVQPQSLPSTPPHDPIPGERDTRDLSTAAKRFLQFQDACFPSVTEKHGPFRYTLPNFDGVAIEHQFMVYVPQAATAKTRWLNVLLADEHFFLDMAGIGERRSLGGMTSFWPVIERGVKYWYQVECTLYMSFDNRFQVDLATLVDLERRPELNRDYLLSQKSSLLDMLLWRIPWYERVYIPSHRNVAGPKILEFPPEPTLMRRSCVGLLHLSYNRSVWRLSEPASFFGSRWSDGPKFKSKEHAMKRYTDVEPTLSDDELRDIVQTPLIRREAYKDGYLDDEGPF